MNRLLNDIGLSMQVKQLNVPCSGDNCTVDMSDIPVDRIVVNVNSVFKAHSIIGKKCDRFLFYIETRDNKLIVALIELKSGTFNTSEVSQQLQNSANVVYNLIPKNNETLCVPILLHGSGNHKSQFKKLRRVHINFGGKKLLILKDKCNIPRNLSSVLKRAKVLS